MSAASEVYLGYEPGDEPAAEAVSRLLGAADFSVWKHEHRLPTARYRAEALAHITNAKMVVILWTEKSRRSAWVLDEADAGARKGILLNVEAGASAPIGYETAAKARIKIGKGGQIAQPHRFQERLAAFAEHLEMRRPKRLWQTRFWYVRLADMLTLLVMCSIFGVGLARNTPANAVAFSLSMFAAAALLGALFDHIAMWLRLPRRAYRWRLLVRGLGEIAGVPAGFIAYTVWEVALKGQHLRVDLLPGLVMAMSVIGAVVAGTRLVPLLLLRWLQVRLLA